MAEKQAATLLDLEALVNEEGALDAIPEAPDFTNPPAGEYVLGCKEAKIDKYESKDEPGIMKQRLKIMYTVAETLSTVDEPPVPDGSMFTETFQATEQGISYFKKRIKEILNVDDVQGVSLASMMQSAQGMQFKARIAIRKTVNPAGGFYENLNIRIIKPTATD